LRISTWNIRGGGGQRLSAIADRLRADDADFGVITEYRTRPGALLKEHLTDRHFEETNPPLNQNGILAYSKSPLSFSKTHGRSMPISGHRWLTVRLAEPDILALGIHIPNQNEKWNKDDFWKRVCAFAQKQRHSRAMILGDFNTGLDADTENEKFLHSAQFQRLLNLGWVDCYRAIHGDRREYTWYSPNGNNGYRLDHIFLSSSLAPRLRDAQFDHEVRTLKLSDHSRLTVDLAN
jgi:exodeoxyribonuclease-3